MESISRRDLLRNLAAGAGGGSVLQLIPAKAAALAHGLIAEEKASSGSYAPKFFSAHQYQTLLLLCDTIIPKDAISGGAIEAGAPEFIDLVASENEEFQAELGGGMMWLDNFCTDRCEHPFLECAAAQQKEVLDLIAYGKNAKLDPALSPGIAFFATLRKMTCDGFYTSRIGIKDLQYVGNTVVAEFPGCPPLPE